MPNQYTEEDRIVQELKAATGWNNIRFVEDSYVISFTSNDTPFIKGLKSGNHNFYLEFESFSHLQLSFFVSVDNTTHQHWTVDSTLHRRGGRPAYVLIDGKNGRVIRRWYWHGLLHRTDGPAKETIKGFSVNEGTTIGSDHHLIESWNHMHCEWYTEGLKAPYPSPHECHITDGWRIRKKTTKKLDSPSEDLSALGGNSAVFSWYSTTKKGMRDRFLPSRAEFAQFNEHYKNGEYVSRNASEMDITWMHGERLITLINLNAMIHDEMISELGLWQAPFFTKDDMEFIILSEYSRLESNEDQ